MDLTIRAELLRRIGTVPESIEIQADEYLFILAAVLAEALILPEALTYYRMHDANSFQLTDRPEPQKQRHKQKSLATLAKSLSEKLEELGIDREVRETVVGYTRMSADQLRLVLDGGWPWETVKTEWNLAAPLPAVWQSVVRDYDAGERRALRPGHEAVFKRWQRMEKAAA